jgi:hypothetical protein
MRNRNQSLQTGDLPDQQGTQAFLILLSNQRLNELCTVCGVDDMRDKVKAANRIRSAYRIVGRG